MDKKHFNCQDCGDLVSEEGYLNPISCEHCSKGRQANDEYDEWLQRELDKG